MWLNGCIDHQNTHKIKFSHILPTGYELIGLLLVVLVLVLLGNSRSLLNYYGLDQSQQVLQQGTSTVVHTGLSQLDKFSFTAKLVTFLIWALIGVVCFSVAQIFGRLYREFEIEGQVSSNHYVHPVTFRRGAFWQAVLSDLISWFITMSVLLAALYVLFGYAMPIAFSLIRKYMEGFHAHDGISFLAGIALLYGWLIIVDSCTRLFINRHRLAKRT